MAFMYKPPVVAAGLAISLASCSPMSQFPQMSMPLLAASAENDESTKTNFTSGEQAAHTLAYAAAPDYERAHINSLIGKYAAQYNLPASFVHRVVKRESTYNPNARNGIHMGLMQLNPTTARTMGYEGPASGLLDPETNLKYGVKYLAGAYLVANGNEDQADRLYQTGYYYHAKAKGLLVETGLRS